MGLPRAISGAAASGLMTGLANVGVRHISTSTPFLKTVNF
jgi:hypothetical protein